MTGFSSQGIFLSYRRDDTAPYARLLKFQLSERIPEADVFMDLDSIEAGLDFAEVIRDAVNSCAVLVALIGPKWTTLTDEEGRRRVDNPDDYVRFEIKTALERRVRVIPVLVDEARPLRKKQLPSELHSLARLNSLELSVSRYQYDADRLLELIQRVLAAVPGNDTAGESSSAASATGPIISRAHIAWPAESIVATVPPQPDPKRFKDDKTPAKRILTHAERMAQSIIDDGYALTRLARSGQGHVQRDDI